MKKIELKDLQPYQVPKHFNMVALGVLGKEESGTKRLSVGVSHFLPGGGADRDGAPVERVYFVLEGEMTVKANNEKMVLKAWDSIHIKPGEDRELINETNKTASMLVIVNFPEA